MARPRKLGIERFPHDCQASGDPKLVKLEKEFPFVGYAFYFKVLEAIYRHGGEINLKDLASLEVLEKTCAPSPEAFKRMFDRSLALSLFDRQMYLSHGILTSFGVRKRAASCLRRRKKEVTPVLKRVPKRDQPLKGKRYYAPEVLMQPIQYERLLLKHGAQKLKELIELLSDYKVQHNVTYNDDAAAIRSWVLKAWDERQPKAQKMFRKSTKAENLSQAIETLKILGEQHE